MVPTRVYDCCQYSFAVLKFCLQLEATTACVCHRVPLWLLCGRCSYILNLIHLTGTISFLKRISRRHFRRPADGGCLRVFEPTMQSCQVRLCQFFDFFWIPSAVRLCYGLKRLAFPVLPCMGWWSLRVTLTQASLRARGGGCLQVSWWVRSPLRGRYGSENSS